MVKTIIDIKSISHGIRPGTIDRLGLVASLRGLFDEIERETGMHIQFFV